MTKKKAPAKATPAKKKLRPDANEIAYRVMREATGQDPKTLPPAERSEDEKDPSAVERGRSGGKRGGKSRAERLTPEQRAEAAEAAARARWKKE